MTVAWRPVWGYYVLLVRLVRIHLIFNLIVGVCIPLITFLIYTQRSAAGGHTRVLVGNILFAALMMIARSPANDMVFTRISGLQRLLATCGLTRSGYLVAVGLFALTFAVCPMGVMALGLLLSEVAPPVSWLWLGPFLLAIASMIGAAYYIGATIDSLPGISLVSNLMVMGSLAFCPLLYPADRVPAFMQPVVDLLPPTLSAESMTAAWQGLPVVWWHLPLLAAWTLLFAVPGIRRFRWTETD